MQLISFIHTALLAKAADAGLGWPNVESRANSNISLPVEVIHDFPQATWIENLAVRRNGQIIVTQDFVPRMYQVDPFSPGKKPTLIHEFNETMAILGIVETTPDIFYVNSANYSLHTLKGFGQAFIFRVDMRNFSASSPGSAKVSKVATLPQAQVLDGLTWLGGNSTILLTSDLVRGVVWSVDFSTGATALAINSTYTRTKHVGVDGLKVRDGSLYFTNANSSCLVKVPIDDKGQAAGNYTLLASGDIFPDDFNFNARGDIFLADTTKDTGGIVVVPRDGGAMFHVARMQGATVCAFGRTKADRNVLYVTTSGGLWEWLGDKPVNVSGKVMKVDVSGLAQNLTLT